MLWFMGFRSLVTKRHYYKSYIKEVLHSPGAPGGSVALKPLITRTSADSKLEYGRPLNHSAMFFFLLHTLAVAFYLMVCVWLQHKSVYDKCRLKCEIGNQNAQQVGTWILSVCAVSGHFPSCDCTQIKVHHPPPAHSSTCMYFCNTASYPLLRNTHLLPSAWSRSYLRVQALCFTSSTIQAT